MARFARAILLRALKSRNEDSSGESRFSKLITMPTHSLCRSVGSNRAGAPSRFLSRQPNLPQAIHPPGPSNLLALRALRCVFRHPEPDRLAKVRHGRGMKNPARGWTIPGRDDRTTQASLASYLPDPSLASPDAQAPAATPHVQTRHPPGPAAEFCPRSA